MREISIYVPHYPVLLQLIALIIVTVAVIKK